MLLNYLACEINSKFLAVRSTWPLYQDAIAGLIKCPLSGRALSVLLSGLQRVWKGSLALGGLIKKSTSCYPKTNCSSLEPALPSGPFIPCFSLSPLHWEMWICHSWKEKRPWCSKEAVMSWWREGGGGSCLWSFHSLNDIMGKAHQLVIQKQVLRPENIHTNNNT